MMDGLFGGDDADDEDETAVEDDPLLEGGNDDLLDGDGLGGDDMVFDDVDGDDGGAATGELENRMDELENEVGSLSSTVNTVKSENEQISESVDDIEENIRKLLEVYEMVTRGVNPFVNENELGNAFDSGGGAGGSMGLFGGDQEEDTGDDDLDEDIADADAADFFDEDVIDESNDDVFADDGFGESDDAFDGGGDAFDDGLDDDFGDEPDDDPDSGKSFEELKDEYESGNANWNDDDEADEEPPVDSHDTAAAGVDEAGGQDDPLDVDANDDPLGTSDEPLDVDANDDPLGTSDEPLDVDASGGDQTGANGSPAASPPADEADDRRPHLATLPAGYASDVLVMEWLEFLVDQGGVDGAARSIAYYESIGWLSETAADDLQTFLNGFGEPVEPSADVTPQSPLSVESHRTSLRYVSRLASSSMGVDVMDRLDAPAPTRNAPQDAHARRPSSGGQPLGGAPVESPGHHGNGAGVPGAGVESDGGHPSTDPLGGPAPGYEQPDTRSMDDGGRIGDGEHPPGAPADGAPESDDEERPDAQPDDHHDD